MRSSIFIDNTCKISENTSLINSTLSLDCHCCKQSY